jgi:hypothetical protein
MSSPNNRSGEEANPKLKLIQKVMIRDMGKELLMNMLIITHTGNNNKEREREKADLIKCSNNIFAQSGPILGDFIQNYPKDFHCLEMPCHGWYGRYEWCSCCEVLTRGS